MIASRFDYKKHKKPVNIKRVITRQLQFAFLDMRHFLDRLDESCDFAEEYQDRLDDDFMDQIRSVKRLVKSLKGAIGYGKD